MITRKRPLEELPTDQNELTFGLNNFKYVKVPIENRKEFLDTNNDNNYFRVYRNN